MYFPEKIIDNVKNIFSNQTENTVFLFKTLEGFYVWVVFLYFPLNSLHTEKAKYHKDSKSITV